MDYNALKLVKKELNSRKNRNPNYSLRSFARSLDVSPSRLSEILSGQRMSKKMANKFANQLGLMEEDKIEFIESIQHQKTSVGPFVFSVNLSQTEVEALLQKVQNLSQNKKEASLKISFQ